MSPRLLVWAVVAVVASSCQGTIHVVAPRLLVTQVTGEPRNIEVDVGAADGGDVKVRVWPMGDPARHEASVLAYRIELVANQPGDGDQNDVGAPAYTAKPGKGHNNYAAAKALASYDMPVGETARLIKFTGVPRGLYRARGQTLDAKGANVTRPAVATGPFGDDQYAISTNVAQVVSGVISIYRTAEGRVDEDDTLHVGIQPLAPAPKGVANPAVSGVVGDDGRHTKTLNGR